MSTGIESNGTQPAPQKNVLVLGFYDRGNLGDEQYKTTIPLFFGTSFRYTFKSIDEAEPLTSSADYDVVVCGGGDIVVGYFMKQVEGIVARYTGPTYAFSVGIPHDNDIAYVDIFDHVVVRSRYDYDLVSKRLGTANTTYLPDVGFMYANTAPLLPNVITEPRFGISLATPVIIARPGLASILSEAISTFMTTTAPTSTATFFLFNTDPRNPDELDATGVQMVLQALPEAVRARCDVYVEPDPSAVVNEMRNMVFNVCMRYHSAVFAAAAKTPLMVLAGSKKIRQLAGDLQLSPEYVVDLDVTLTPISIANTMAQRALDRTTVTVPDVGRYQGNATLEAVVQDRVFRRLRVPDRDEINKTIQDAIDAVIKLLNAFYGYEHVTNDTMFRKGRFNLLDKDAVKVSRIVCFAITGDYDNPCVWGLSENMIENNEFVLYDAVAYILDDLFVRQAAAQKRDSEVTELYYPSAGTGPRPMLSIDPFLQAFGNGTTAQRDVHRSGWSYVTNHLQNFQAARFRRPATLIVDTFVERTFHWGFDALMLSGVLPYQSDWVGFVHHTYDKSSGTYNCEELFKNPIFLESLRRCRCLYALSRYLAAQLAQSVAANGFGGRVAVEYLAHPMEFVPISKRFMMSSFAAAPERKVVQIGAWLRNSYAIFDLPLHKQDLSGNPLAISKVALKGDNMDGYYISEEMFTKIVAAIDGVATKPIQPYTCDPTVPTPSPAQQRNKFVAGMIAALEKSFHSVDVLEKQANNAYDDLLSNSVVFLELVDCSAVNTILECLVRNTIIVVNRHPAIEEVLGEGYPGFYDSLIEATVILGSIDTLNACFSWLTQLDKSAYRIETFIAGFVDSVAKLPPTGQV